MNINKYNMKISKETVNERIKDRGLTMVSDYITAKTKSEFICSHNHPWWATPDSVVRGNGCPACSRNLPLSKEIVNERIKDRGLELIGDYINYVTKSQFKCQHDHYWMASPSNVDNTGRGCPHCACQAPLTKEIVNERIKDRGLELIGDYVSAHVKSEFKCKHDHYWMTRPNGVVRGGGCPTCAICGFNTNKPAWEYGFTRNGYLKYGITGDLPRRLYEHRKHGEIKLVHERYHELGQLALDWENYIKRTYGGRFATKEQCPDGFTETLCESKLGVLLNF